MKRYIQAICFLLVFSLLFFIPVSAAENSTDSSAFFASYDSFIRNPSDSTIRIWFDVMGNDTMEAIGVSSIELEYSSDENIWFHAKTFLPEDYPQMIWEDSYFAYDYVTYTGMYDFCYRAYVTFYAKNSRGQGYMSEYSETFYIPMP